jgi:S-DNA-T family DNA segregation ATPase FtsK/SpoIIIE
MRKSYQEEINQGDVFLRFTWALKNLTKPVQEIIRGITRKTIPWNRVVMGAVLVQGLLVFRLDESLFRLCGLAFLYPSKHSLLYFTIMSSSPLLLWGIGEALRRERVTKALIHALEAIGLKNSVGKLPTFIFDLPLDKWTRKLRLSRAGITAQTFEQNKGALEGAMNIFIDEFREDRLKGTIDVIYSTIKMPETFKVSDYRDLKPPTFVVGVTRSKVIKSSLIENPHLLIAGQSGGGKSTFTRQLIATLYLNDPDMKFTIIDLKGTVESQFFENRSRIVVPDSMNNVLYALDSLEQTIDYRLKLLKANSCKDALDYFRLPRKDRTLIKPPSQRVEAGLNRHLVVVDEAAEMFLAGEGRSTANIQKARGILSRIARQGRAIGIHLVVATQRPDARALDTQIKANLTGVLCFPMANDASSILVLGNGRATDLPAIPGRALWKMGRDMFEVQTPLLTTTELKALFDDQHVLDSKHEKSLDHDPEYQPFH